MRPCALVFALLLVLGGAAARADSWMAPTEKDYFSPDRSHRMRVVPGNRRDGKPCRAVLERRGKPWLKYQMVWSRELLNEVTPVHVVISPDGKYVATFDDWYAAGHGPYAASIYGPRGELIKAFGLMDLLMPAEIDRLSMSLSSIEWFAAATFGPRSGTLDLSVLQNDDKGNASPTISLRIRLPAGQLERPSAEAAEIEAQKARCRSLAGAGPNRVNRCPQQRWTPWCGLCIDMLRVSGAPPSR